MSSLDSVVSCQSSVRYRGLLPRTAEDGDKFWVLLYVVEEEPFPALLDWLRNFIMWASLAVFQ